MQRRHVLANSCARAASAEEARYRIDAPITDERSTAVFALDPPAREIVAAHAAGRFPRVRFLACVDRSGDGEATAPAATAPAAGNGRPGAVADSNGSGRPTGAAPPHAVPIRGDDVSARPLAEAVADADLVVMVATAPQVRAAAAAIGDVCARLHVMAAGLALGAHDVDDGAVSALRPHSHMLLVSEDAADLGELLAALRA